MSGVRRSAGPGWPGRHRFRVLGSWLARAALVVLLALMSLAGGATPATAHSDLTRTEPAKSSVVEQAPKFVLLHFTEPVQMGPDALRVFDGTSTRVDRGVPQVNGQTVRVNLERLDQGTYAVAWQATGDDGHSLRGAFIFSVGEPGASDASAAAVAGFGEVPPVLETAGGVARALAYLTALLLFGPLLFVLVVWRPALRRLGARAVDEAMRRVFGRLMPWVWGAAVAASLAVLVTETALRSVGSGTGNLGSAAGQALGSTFGIVWMVRVALLVAVLPLLRSLLDERTAPRGRPSAARQGRHLPRSERAEPVLAGSGPLSRRWVQPRLVAAVLLSAGVAGSAAFWGHLPTPRVPATLTALTHVLSMSAWVGGLACLTLLPLVLRGQPEQLRPHVLGQVVPRFSTFASVAVILLVASGIYLAVLQVGSWTAVLASTYGWLLVAKIAGFAAVLLLGAYNLLWSRRRLKAAVERPAVSARWAARLRRTVTGELALTAAVIAVAAALVAATPPRTEDFSTSTRVGPDRLAVFLYPARVGRPAQLYLTLSAPGGGVDTEVVKTKVALSLPAQELGPLTLPVRRVGPGRFVVDRAIVPLGGKWDMDVFIERSDNVGFFGRAAVNIEEIQ